VKELFEIGYVRSDVRQFVIDMTDSLTQPTPPAQLLIANGRIDRKMQEDMAPNADLGIAWDDGLVRAGIHMFVTLLPHDHSLLKQLVNFYKIIYFSKLDSITPI
jgi:hypothetical protein